MPFSHARSVQVSPHAIPLLKDCAIWQWRPTAHIPSSQSHSPGFGRLISGRTAGVSGSWATALGRASWTKLGETGSKIRQGDPRICSMPRVARAVSHSQAVPPARRDGWKSRPYSQAKDSCGTVLVSKVPEFRMKRPYLSRVCKLSKVKIDLYGNPSRSKTSQISCLRTSFFTLTLTALLLLVVLSQCFFAS